MPMLTGLRPLKRTWPAKTRYFRCMLPAVPAAEHSIVLYPRIMPLKLRGIAVFPTHIKHSGPNPPNAGQMARQTRIPNPRPESSLATFFFIFCTSSGIYWHFTLVVSGFGYDWFPFMLFISGIYPVRIPSGRIPFSTPTAAERFARCGSILIHREGSTE